MNSKIFRTICSIIAFLQLVTVFTVSYQSIILSDSLQLILVPILLVLMLDMTLFLTVEALVKLIINKRAERAKAICILIISLIYLVTVSVVWIYFMVVLLKNSGENGYITDSMIIDRIIMFYPVAAVLLLAPIYAVFRFGIRFPSRRRKKQHIKDDKDENLS
ncbi:MAG: hypothetical protein IKJ69_04100 [Clostridia bacterium]|nr:hypothetical protein [Clostridia bacterium]